MPKDNPTLPGSDTHLENSGRNTVAKIIVVTSGKGGVGKTTTSASFASGLALRGKKVAVIDFWSATQSVRAIGMTR